MDTSDIKRIIELMKDNELSEFELEEEGFRIAIKRRNGMETQVMVTPQAASPVIVAGGPAGVHGASGDTAAGATESPQLKTEIRSPMVGTFYRSSSPDAEPFATVGQQVDEDTVVCIIEAMKVMNEIKAEVKGVIRKVLVENATPIEYGQPLFEVEPA